ncbi:MAG: DHA2 family efflux MFS transporter permease subunit [Hyphomicrobiales bacterium]|nr:DHA2 family efflux MFS transporter permease subunit [Hyphomicrobiales bacterium]
MEVLDTTIANVVLPYIAGGMGVSDDEASWVVTTYLVANAISLTASPYLARRLGRKTFFLICLGLFSISSLLCAQAWNLDSLLLFRILQGVAGGGMVPVSQSILADAFPPQKRGQAFALFGVAVVVAPVVGPTLGGWLADNLTWRWCFLINGPVGFATMALIAMLLPADKPNESKVGRFDFIGFFLVASFLGALEIVLDRGLEDDWFGSSFIITFTVICALAFVLMIPWEMSRKDPMIDLHMVATRQFGACFLVMGATGAILYATTQFLPLLVQSNFGYTATWAGLVLSPGGLVTMVMMFAVGQLSSRVQPKYLIMTGAVFCAISMYQLTSVYGDLNFWFLARTRIFLGFGLPLIFIPIIAASYDGIPANRIDMASALINAARNTGGSIGVSLASNVLNHREQFHQSRLIEHAVPSSQQYQDTLQQVTQYFLAQGNLLPQAQQQAIAWIGQQVQTQASYLAYMDVFWVLTLLSIAAVPLAMSLRKVKLGGAAPAAH